MESIRICGFGGLKNFYVDAEVIRMIYRRVGGGSGIDVFIRESCF